MLIRRYQSLTGAIGIALVFVALFLPGPPPKATDSSAVLTATLVDHRTALVAGVLVAGGGLMALVWFFGVLGARLRHHDEVDLALSIAAVAGGVVGITLMFMGMLLFSGTAFRAASMGDPALVRATVDTGNIVIESSKYGFAVLILATCASAAHTGFLSRRTVTTGVTAAVILIASTFPPFLVDHGIGQFGGGIDVLGGIPGFVWIIALSIAMTRQTATPTVAAATSGDR